MYLYRVPINGSASVAWILPLKDIKEEVQGSMICKTTFLQRYDQMLEDLRKQVGVEITERSLSTYCVFRKHLQAFISEQFHSKDISFRQITENFLDELHAYSTGKCQHSQGYYRKIALAVKKVCRLAFREGLTDRLLFEHIKIERGDSRLPRALDRASLDKIQQVCLEPYELELQLARNLFLFTCYTGVAFCDMVSLRREHLVQDDTGASWLKFRRQKTDTLCRIKLLPQAEAVLNLYSQANEEPLLPAISYQSYSIHLKALQLRAGISIPLTAHIGRHTFATLITLENGVSLETVSKMLGHSSIQTTERYAQVTPTKLFEDFGRFLSFTADLTLNI